MNDFRKENRYQVLKLSDIEAAKQAHPRSARRIEKALALLEQATTSARFKAGKEPLTCCVVESDWRCYEGVWSLVEAEYNSNAWAGEVE